MLGQQTCIGQLISELAVSALMHESSSTRRHPHTSEREAITSLTRLVHAFQGSGPSINRRLQADADFVQQALAQYMTNEELVSVLFVLVPESAEDWHDVCP